MKRPPVVKVPKKLNTFQKLRPNLVKISLLVVFAFVGAWVVLVLTALVRRRMRANALSPPPRLSSVHPGGPHLHRVAPAPKSPRKADGQGQAKSPAQAKSPPAKSPGQGQDQTKSPPQG